MQMVLQPQEVEAYYLIPAIRRGLAAELKSRGVAQIRIAGMLGVTPAAVSQYLHDKRGVLDLPGEMHILLKEAAARISDRDSMVREMQMLLSAARKTKFICRLHEQLEEGVPKGCDICFK